MRACPWQHSTVLYALRPRGRASICFPRFNSLSGTSVFDVDVDFRSVSFVVLAFALHYSNCFFTSAGTFGFEGKSCENPFNSATVFSARFVPSCTAIFCTLSGS